MPMIGANSAKSSHDSQAFGRGECFRCGKDRTVQNVTFPALAPHGMVRPLVPAIGPARRLGLGSERGIAAAYALTSRCSPRRSPNSETERESEARASR